MAYVDDSPILVDEIGSVVSNKNPAESGQKLTWNLVNLKITLQPAALGVTAEYRQLSFDAEAIVTVGMSLSDHERLVPTHPLNTVKPRLGGK